MSGPFMSSALNLVMLEDLDGKTLTIRVGIATDQLNQQRVVTVVGRDSRGVCYVLAEQRESIDVHPHQR